MNGYRVKPGMTCERKADDTVTLANKKSSYRLLNNPHSLHPDYTGRESLFGNIRRLSRWLIMDRARVGPGAVD
jgi:hypothetical protein